MKTNLIDEMTELEAKVLLNAISELFGIGSHARTGGVILGNTENAVRRARCLSRIESHMTTTEVDDGEEYEDCPLNWGDGPDEYFEKFKKVIGENILDQIEMGMVGNPYLWKNKTGVDDTVTIVDRIELKENGDVIVFSTVGREVVANDLSRFLEALTIDVARVQFESARNEASDRYELEQKDLAELRPCYSVTGLEKFIAKCHSSYHLAPNDNGIADSPDVHRTEQGGYAKITKRLADGTPLHFTDAVDKFTPCELNDIAYDMLSRKESGSEQ